MHASWCREGEQERLGVQGAVSGEASQLAVCCWRGRATLNILVAKQECSQVWWYSAGLACTVHLGSGFKGSCLPQTHKQH